MTMRELLSLISLFRATVLIIGGVFITMLPTPSAMYMAGYTMGVVGLTCLLDSILLIIGIINQKHSKDQ